MSVNAPAVRMFPMLEKGQQDPTEVLRITVRSVDGVAALLLELTRAVNRLNESGAK